MINHFTFDSYTGMHNISYPKESEFLTPYGENLGNDLYSNWKIIIPYLSFNNDNFINGQIIIVRHHDVVNILEEAPKFKRKYLGAVIIDRQAYHIFMIKE